MTNEDKANLASAYMSAWNAVKGRPCTVTVEPNGWFTVSLKGWGLPDRRRASALLNGLVVLTQQLEKRAVA